MKYLTVFRIAIMGCLAAFSTAAEAAECGPQKINASIDLILAGVPLAHVTVAGKPKLMIVDTGGFTTELFRPVARQLGLSMLYASTGGVGINGKASNLTALIPDLGLGGLHARNIRVLVAGDDGADIPDDTPAGLIGANILQNYDADFDFAAGKLNLIDPDHCDGRTVYWPAKTVAVVPFRLDPGFHITLSAEVEGKSMMAILDTGASTTAMNLDSAQTLFHVDTNSADVEKVGEIKGGRTANVYRTRFKSIALNGVTISNPEVVLLPDMIRSRSPQPPTGELMAPPSADPPRLPDLILGMSTLSKLHVYIAYRERKLYLTEAAPPQ